MAGRRCPGCRAHTHLHAEPAGAGPGGAPGQTLAVRVPGWESLCLIWMTRASARSGVCPAARSSRRGRGRRKARWARRAVAEGAQPVFPPDLGWLGWQPACGHPPGRAAFPLPQSPLPARVTALAEHVDGLAAPSASVTRSGCGPAYTEDSDQEILVMPDSWGRSAWRWDAAPVLKLPEGSP
jgi:hypothetical protein